MSSRLIASPPPSTISSSSRAGLKATGGIVGAFASASRVDRAIRTGSGGRSVLARGDVVRESDERLVGSADGGQRRHRGDGFVGELRDQILDVTEGAGA